MPNFMTTRLISALSVAALLGGILPVQTSAQNTDPARAKILSVEQATELLKRPNALRLGVTELAPEAASVLAGFKGTLTFEVLSSLSPAAAAALSPYGGELNLPGLKTLDPDVAAGLAKREHGSLILPGITQVSVEAAKAMADYKGNVNLAGVKEVTANLAAAFAPHAGMLVLGSTEVSDDTAAALAKHVGGITLGALARLTSTPLARKLGEQERLSLNSVTSITKDVADALGPRAGEKKHHVLGIGLKELPADVAESLARGWELVYFTALLDLSADAAAALAKHRTSHLGFNVLEKLSPEAARSLAHAPTLLVVLYSLKEVSPEVELAMGSGPASWQVWALTKITKAEFATALVKRQGPHRELDKVAFLSDEAAGVFAADSSDAAVKNMQFPGLTSLTHVPLAAKLAIRHKDLKLAKLTAVPDDVAKALASQKGKLDLSGVQSLSAEAAKALAGHEGELKLDGVKEISDEAAKALAQAVGAVSLSNLTTASPEAAGMLKGNAKIALPAKLK